MRGGINRHIGGILTVTLSPKTTLSLSNVNESGPGSAVQLNPTGTKGALLATQNGYDTVMTYL